MIRYYKKRKVWRFLLNKRRTALEIDKSDHKKYKVYMASFIDEDTEDVYCIEQYVINGKTRVTCFKHQYDESYNIINEHYFYANEYLLENEKCNTETACSLKQKYLSDYT